MLEKAIEIAVNAHKGQKDKNGAPYILHVIRVMCNGKTETEKICGVLHDLIEDTDWTFDRLKKEGFSNEVIDALRCLTKESEEEDYTHFINRIKENKIAINIKLNDLKDNMNILRMKKLVNKDIARLNKYLKAYNELIKL